MAKIKGKVIGKDNKGVAEVSLNFTGKQNQDQDDLETDNNGVFTTKTLKAGDYIWSAQKDGYVNKAGEIDNLLSGKEERSMDDITIELTEAVAPAAGGAAAGGGAGGGAADAAAGGGAGGGAGGAATGGGAGGGSAAGQPGSISGLVTDQAGKGLPGATVTATDVYNVASQSVQTDASGNYSVQNLAPGVYTVEVQNPQGYVPAQNVVVIAGIQVKGIDFSLDPIMHFRGILDDQRFSIESPISYIEAEYAVDFFHIVNLILSGLSDTNGKTDLFGSQNIKDPESFNISKKSAAWDEILKKTDTLRTILAQLETTGAINDVRGEAKRQFNLGTSNNVPGNVQFPSLFKRYVEIALDPLIGIDIATEDQPGSYLDKTKIAQADDLLKELKRLILQIVRSLSRYGRAQTRLDNTKWAPIITSALEMAQLIGRERNTGDEDDQNVWAVVAALTGKNRETEVAPYIVLGRHGGKLLEIALDVYKEIQNNLDVDDKDSLRKLFQSPGQEFRTNIMRREASVIKRYPLANWG